MENEVEVQNNVPNEGGKKGKSIASLILSLESSLEIEIFIAFLKVTTPPKAIYQPCFTHSLMNSTLPEKQ